jgi:hypothetical protein
VLGLASGAAAAPPAPAWYTAGSGGINNNIADFYQHQNFDPRLAGNAWEADGGWCAPIAFSDTLYDLTTRGYTKLLSPGITNNATWLTTAYGPAGAVNQGDLYRVATNYFGFGPQPYLNQAGNLPGTTTPLLQINSFDVGANGKVSYFSPAAGGVVQTNQSAFTFYDAKMRAGDDALVQIGEGTLPANSHWWNFHMLAGAGDRVADSTIFVADPNTNKNSEFFTNGWPKFTATDPKTIDPFRFAAGDPIPTPNNPNINNAASYNSYYTPLQLAGDKITDLSGATFTLTGATVDAFHVITPSKAGVLFDGLWPNPNNNLEKTVLAVGAISGAINGIYIAPGSTVSSMGSLDSISLSGWTTSLNNVDPFGNSRSYGGIEFLSNSLGNDLAAGSSANLSLATLSSFVAQGFDLFLHYEGNASNDWDVEVFGQNPVLPGLQIGVVPEPSTLVLAGIACTLLAAVGVVRTRMRKAGVVGRLACWAWAAVLLALAGAAPARAGSVLLTAEWLEKHASAPQGDRTTPSPGPGDLDQAARSFQAGDFDTCLKQLGQAVHAHPELPPPHALFATMALRADRVSLARLALERAVAEDPAHPEVFILFGDLALREARLTDAALHFEKATALASAPRWAAERRRDFEQHCLQGQAAVAEARGTGRPRGRRGTPG